MTEDPPICNYDPERDSFPGGHFPKDFRWSLATAAYQIEGAVNEGLGLIYEIVKVPIRPVDESLIKDGKGQNIWDTWVHQRYPEDPSKAWFDLIYTKIVGIYNKL